MSRLIVKGLPRRYDEELVRKLFSCGGDVTDAKVMRTSDGRSRQFAFVGFRNKAEADKARQKLHQTYVDASQVFVEVARPVGDNQIARPWSKYSKGSSRHAAVEASQTAKLASDGHVSRAASGNPDKGIKKQDESEAMCRKNISKSGPAQKESDDGFGMFREAVSKRSRTPMWTDSILPSQATLRKSLVESRKAGGEGHMLERSHIVFGDELDDEDDNEDELYEALPASTSEHLDGKDQDGDKRMDKQESAPSDRASLDQAAPTRANDDIDDLEYFKSKVCSDVQDGVSDSSDEEVGESDAEDVAKDTDACNEDERSESEASEDSSRESGDASTEDHRLGKPGPSEKDKKSALDVDVCETGRLFVRNLAFSVTPDELEALFEPFGALADVHLVQDARTGQSRGVAFILFVVPENAAKAMAALDGQVFSGRLLHVLPGRPRPQSKSQVAGMSTAGPGTNTFKAGREAERKESARAGTDSNAFNAMYMGSDSVAAAMASRYGVGKADIYGTGDGGDSGSAAVRLAAGEARLQAETVEFFSRNGVDLKVAHQVAGSSRSKKLSRNAFLAKNLPAGVDGAILEGLFGKFGSVDRVLVAPAGLLAVVIFEFANDAKRAYSSLAYTRFKDVPLYLEWLPREAILGRKDRLPGIDENTNANAGQMKAEKIGRDVVRADIHTGDDAKDNLCDSLPQTSVFVKNLNFDTGDEALRKHVLNSLRRHPKLSSGLRSATVATRPDKKNPTGPRLSYGYGFLEFATESSAGNAMKLLQGSILDGHSLELRLANRPAGRSGRESGRKRPRATASLRKPSTKLMVRNIAFEATQRDMRRLFETFGQVQSIRLPRKQDNSHRGFGFIEFVSKNEATAALNALSSAHLYGRHLVVDYAEEQENGVGSLEELQAKAARHATKRRRTFEQGNVEEVAQNNDDEAEMLDAMYG